MMRKRFNSESENTTNFIVVEQENLYKDKPAASSITSKFFNIINPTTTSGSKPLAPSNQPNYLNSSSRGSEEDFLNNEPEREEEIFVMTARDRSGEFTTCIRNLQGRNINRVVNIRDPKKVKQMQNYSEFMITAKSIGRNIASTYSKLEKLTLRK
jgi:hypothetical protein